MPTPLRVVAAAIYNTQGQCLLAQRPPNKALAGLWEFPGGKLEIGESEEQAIARELQEELELQVRINERIGEFTYTYPTGPVTLVVFKVLAMNEPKTTLEVQRYKWLYLHQVETTELVPADIPVLRHLREISD